MSRFSLPPFAISAIQANQSVSQEEFCDFAVNKLSYVSACAQAIAHLYPHPVTKGASTGVKIISLCAKGYCTIAKFSKKENPVEISTTDTHNKAVQFLKSSLETFFDAHEIGGHSDEARQLNAFIDNEVKTFAASYQSTLPMGDQFSNHIQTLAQEHHWPEQTKNNFGILFSHEVAKYTTQDDSGSFKIAPPALSKSLRFDQAALEKLISSRFHSVINEYESTLPVLFSEHFSSSVMKNSFQNDNALTEEQLIQLTEITSEEMQVTVGNLESPNAQASSVTVLRTVSCLMQDGAMLAAIFQKPSIAQNFSTVSSGITRFTTGLENLSQATEFLLKLSAFVSMFTGVSAVVSGIIGFLTNQKDPMVCLNEKMDHLGKQLEHVGKQLECVLHNQKVMMGALFLNAEHLQEMDDRLKRFAQTTRQNLEFIATKDLIQASHRLNQYFTDDSALKANQADLLKWVKVLETWLTAPLHLCSKNMNGGILNWNDSVPAKDSIEILSQCNDWPSSMNMVGFILKQLVNLGINIPPQYLNLPPLETYTKTVVTYYLGLMKLDHTSSHGCHSVAQSIEETFALFSSLILFLQRNNGIWQQLQQKYLDNLTRIRPALLALNHDSNESDDSLKTLLSEESESVEKTHLLNTIDATEEIRLLLIRLSEWTGRFRSFLPTLSSREDILQMTGCYLSERSCNVFIHETYENTQWLLTSEIKDSEKNSLSLGYILLSDKMTTLANQFLEPTLLEHLFKNYLYELMMLHIASTDEGTYTFLHEVDNCKVENLRTAYQYYVAVRDDNFVRARDLRSFVDSHVLLWLVSILGGYDIFFVDDHDDFDFSEGIGSMHIKTSSLTDDWCKLSVFECLRPYIGFGLPLPLILAAKWNRKDVVEGLLEEHRQGKDIGLTEKDPLGRTAAHTALDHRHYALAQLIDNHSHTLSDDERKALDLKIKMMARKNTAHQDISEVLKNGHLLGKAIEAIGKQNEGKLLIETRTTACPDLKSNHTQNEAEVTDDEDQLLLEESTSDFAEQNTTDYLSSLWKKPTNAKSGTREITRSDVPGNSAKFIHTLRGLRKKEDVLFSKDTITVNLLTRQPTLEELEQKKIQMINAQLQRKIMQEAEQNERQTIEAQAQAAFQLQNQQLIQQGEQTERQTLNAHVKSTFDELQRKIIQKDEQIKRKRVEYRFDYWKTIFSQAQLSQTQLFLSQRIYLKTINSEGGISCQEVGFIGLRSLLLRQKSPRLGFSVDIDCGDAVASSHYLYQLAKDGMSIERYPLRRLANTVTVMNDYTCSASITDPFVNPDAAVTSELPTLPDKSNDYCFSDDEKEKTRSRIDDCFSAAETKFQGQDPQGVHRILNTLFSAGFFTHPSWQANLALLTTHHAKLTDISLALFNLHTMGLLTQTLFTATVKHAQPVNCAKALLVLFNKYDDMRSQIPYKKAGKLDDEITVPTLSPAMKKQHEDFITTVITHPHPLEVAKLIVFLHDRFGQQKMSADVLAAIRDSKDKRLALVGPILYYVPKGIITNENCLALLKCTASKLQDITNAIKYQLARNKKLVLTQAFFDCMIAYDPQAIGLLLSRYATHADSETLAEVLAQLAKAGINIQENIEHFRTHKDIVSLTQITHDVIRAGVSITQPIFYLLRTHPNPSNKSAVEILASSIIGRDFLRNNLKIESGKCFFGNTKINEETLQLPVGNDKSLRQWLCLTPAMELMQEAEEIERKAIDKTDIYSFYVGEEQSAFHQLKIQESKEKDMRKVRQRENERQQKIIKNDEEIKRKAIDKTDTYALFVGEEQSAFRELKMQESKEKDMRKVRQRENERNQKVIQADEQRERLTIDAEAKSTFLQLEKRQSVENVEKNEQKERREINSDKQYFVASLQADFYKTQLFLSQLNTQSLLQLVVDSNKYDLPGILSLLSKSNPARLKALLSDNTAIVEEHSTGQTIKNKTLLQAAIAMGDFEICMILKPYLGDEFLNQFSLLFPDGVEAHISAQKKNAFNFNAILQAIEQASDDSLCVALRHENNGSALCRALKEFRRQFTDISRQDTLFNPHHSSRALELLVKFSKKLRNKNKSLTHTSIDDSTDYKRYQVIANQIFGYTQRFMTMYYDKALRNGGLILKHRFTYPAQSFFAFPQYEEIPRANRTTAFKSCIEKLGIHELKRERTNEVPINAEKLSLGIHFAISPARCTIMVPSPKGFDDLASDEKCWNDLVGNIQSNFIYMSRHQIDQTPLYHM